MYKYFVLTFAMGLSGCASVNDFKWGESNSQPCLVAANTETFIGDCDLWYWVGVWVEADDMTWQQRQQRISTLSDSLPHRLEKILLSQPMDTPYQARLRASLWLDDIFPLLSEPMQRALTTMVQHPSNRILESESAIALLTKVSGERQLAIEQLEQQLEQQQKKLEALVDIESTIETDAQE